MTDNMNYIDRDDLGLFCTFIERVTVTFNPTRTIKFDIIRPVDLSEAKLRYNKGTLTFKNVIQSDIELKNERHEYPEFHRSAILDKSDLLTTTIESKGTDKENYKDYYMLIDHGNSQNSYHIICGTHELIIENNPKHLKEYDGFLE